MKQHEPVRLIEAEENAALRDALHEARGALGTQADVARVRLKLESAIELGAAGTSVGGANAWQAAAWSRIALNLVLFAAGGGALIAGWNALQARSAEPQTARIERVVEPPAKVVAPEPPAAAVTPQPTALEQATVEALPPRVEKPARKKQLATPQPVAEVATPAPARSELSLLHEAQDKLELSPQRALALLEQHAADYAQGNFALERESLAIAALRKLGRDSAARARAERFVERYAHAPQTNALRAWLEESAHKNPASPLPTR